jgi:predicted membrane channel-forming protein YqfA (hemolysin III family)
LVCRHESGKFQFIVSKSLSLEATLLFVYVYRLLFQTAAQWRVVFYLGGVIYAAGAVFYILFASGNIQLWASGNGYEEVLLNNDNAVEDGEEELNR